MMENIPEPIQTGIRLIDLEDAVKVVTTMTKNPNEGKALYLELLKLDGVTATVEQMLQLKGNKEIKLED